MILRVLRFICHANTTSALVYIVPSILRDASASIDALRKLIASEGASAAFASSPPRNSRLRILRIFISPSTFHAQSQRTHEFRDRC